MKARLITSMLSAVALTAWLAGSAEAQTTPPPQTAAPSTPEDASPTAASDVAVGYSFLREAGVNGGPANVYGYGWVAAFSYRFGSTPIYGVGEITGNYRHSADQLWQLYGYLGGARIYFYRSGPIAAFAQALVGAEQFKVPGFSETGFAFQPGGGVDMPLGGTMKLRVQGDFRLAHQSDEDTTFKELRIAASVVIPIKK